jgi:ribonuclease HII
MIPQPASDGTTSARHSLKQGVVRVPKVERKLMLKDGTIKDWKELTEEERKAFAQKIMNELVVPLAVDQVLREMQQEREAAN